ncbi:uncharacterized protein LOC130655119 [Hydractinia symbiolongicarpus]|uniref:uncharacterized protein LOC130655119 n=1 Tax=Hydractinia symbiolongicarpus TaxID=13093 RepID=UPI00255014BF|nr:uncharacterized protein LOC130655119 [Hydractinia symbiolongicarpus]
MQLLWLLLLVTVTIVEAKEFRCNFIPGDGSGGTEILIGYKRTISHCIKACTEKRWQNPKINGVTIPSKKTSNVVKCYCEIGMTGTNKNTRWQTCFMQLPELSCNFIIGDGSGGTEVNIGYKRTASACINACAEKRSTNPKINGVTIPSKTADKFKCYCEIGMTATNRNSKWKTCLISPPKLSCNFITGDGSGGTEANIGYKKTASACIYACAAMRSKNPKINGVTIPRKTADKFKCYCEIGMTDTNGNSKWKTCFMSLPDAPCKFIKGDGTGGPEIHMGYKKTVKECIKACVAKKAQYSDINGVTISRKGRVNCYCERRMTSSNGSASWKTCRI